MQGFKKQFWISLVAIAMLHPAYAVPKIIFDTDIARVDSTGRDRSDIDDLGALAILNALTGKQRCEIIAVVANSRSNRIVEMIDAVNTFYHHPGIPVGLKEGSAHAIEDKNSYARYISARFPHTQHTADAPSSTELLRKVLTEVSEADTVIYIHADAIANWDFLCISPFLASGADAVSEMTGWELFNAKVDQFISYIPCLPNQGISENCPSWCNTPTTNGAEVRHFLNKYQHALIGNATAVQEAHLPTRLWKQADENPVKAAYQYYYSQTPPPWQPNNEIPDSISIYGDGLGIIYLVAKGLSEHLFSTVNGGSFFVDQDNKLRWSAEPGSGNHRYFYTVPKYRSELWKLIDDLICYRPD